MGATAALAIGLLAAVLVRRHRRAPEDRPLKTEGGAQTFNSTVAAPTAGRRASAVRILMRKSHAVVDELAAADPSRAKVTGRLLASHGHGKHEKLREHDQTSRSTASKEGKRVKVNPSRQDSKKVAFGASASAQSRDPLFQGIIDASSAGGAPAARTPISQRAPLTMVDRPSPSSASRGTLLGADPRQRPTPRADHGAQAAQADRGVGKWFASFGGLGRSEAMPAEVQWQQALDDFKSGGLTGAPSSSSPRLPGMSAFGSGKSVAGASSASPSYPGMSRSASSKSTGSATSLGGDVESVRSQKMGKMGSNPNMMTHHL